MKRLTAKCWERKKWQIILFVFGILVVLASFTWLKPPEPPTVISGIEELEAYIKEKVDAGKTSGVSFAVVKNNRVVYSNGFGWADGPRKIAATPESVYHWWSVTKIVTAMAILQLQERGKLRLDDPVILHLPFFNIKYPSDSSKAITIRNLLNHSSGIPDPGFRIISWIHHDGEPAVNQTALVKRVLPRYSKLAFEPGADKQYTNIGYMVLGAVIEQITGQAYEDYIRQNILAPLGMKHTDFVYTKAMEPNEAAGSHPLFSIYTPAIPFMCGTYVRETFRKRIWLDRVYTDQTPSTGLIGPVTDASRLIMAYLNHGELDGQRILSEESVAAMTHEGHVKAKKDDPQSSRQQGIGWLVFGKHGQLMLAHDGGGIGFFTLIQVMPEQNLGFVLFTNDVTFNAEGWKIVNMAARLNW